MVNITHGLLMLLPQPRACAAMLAAATSQKDTHPKVMARAQCGNFENLMISILMIMHPRL